MDHVNPKELVQDPLRPPEKQMGVIDMLIRAALSGVFLGFATSLALSSSPRRRLETP
jgi:hypothetical protein